MFSNCNHIYDYTCNIMTILPVALVHFAVTLPSFLWYLPHTIYNRYVRAEDLPIVFYSDPSRYQDDPNDGNHMVVMVHGRNGRSSDFDPLIRNLQYICVTNPIIAVNLGPTGSTSVCDDSQVLYNLLRDYQHRKIILIGLSKGGLIIGDFLTQKNITNVVALITISSPLSGTQIVNILPENHITRQELGYNSIFTKKLQSSLLSNSVPVFHVVPTWDHLIIPTSSAFIDKENHKHKVYAGLNGHCDISRAIEVAQFIKEWISNLNK